MILIPRTSYQKMMAEQKKNADTVKSETTHDKEEEDTSQNDNPTKEMGGIQEMITHPERERTLHKKNFNQSRLRGRTLSQNSINMKMLLQTWVI